MNKKMLYILNIADRVNNFSYTSMKAAQELGMDFHIAGNWNYKNDEERMSDEKKYGIHIYQVDFMRAPYHLGNINAYNQLAKIVCRENFDVIHCNSPIGGVIGRILGKRNNIKKIIYQAHGFHFYDGAPVFNWIVYYTIEKWLAKYTDVLITINNEDYVRARKFKLKKGGKVYYVPGVGIDTEKFNLSCSIRKEKRAELGISENSILLLSAGDLVKRKNYTTAIRAVSKAKDRRLQYYICGRGPEGNKLEKLARELNLQDQVHFIGFRTDIKELMNAADIFVFSTLQEGLPRSLSEAMAAGLPCVASKIRGNTDLVEDGKTGILCCPTDEVGFAEAIEWLATDVNFRHSLGIECRKRIKDFDVKASQAALYDIYLQEKLGEGDVLI